MNRCVTIGFIFKGECSVSIMNSSDIITYDKKGDNLLIGGLRVNNRKELEELRDELLQEKRLYQVSTSENLGGLSSMIRSGFSREGDHLVHRKITDSDPSDGVSLYTEKVIECTVLNSLLLMIGLSGELDVINYDGLAKQFIRTGIIQCKRIENIWGSCSNNIVKGVFAEISKNDQVDLNQLLTNDLILFRNLLQEGIITYDVIKEIPFGKMVDEAVFKAWNMKTKEELEINNALLLKEDAIFQEYMRKRKK